MAEIALTNLTGWIHPCKVTYAENNRVLKCATENSHHNDKLEPVNHPGIYILYIHMKEQFKKSGEKKFEHGVLNVN